MTKLAPLFLYFVIPQNKKLIILITIIINAIIGRIIAIRQKSIKNHSLFLIKTYKMNICRNNNEHTMPISSILYHIFNNNNSPFYNHKKRKYR